MKTWEMIRELTENPSKRFKSTHKDNLTASTYVEIGQGGLYFKNSESRNIPIYFIGFDWDWEEVNQPVTFMGVVEECGKLFKVKHAYLKSYMWNSDAMLLCNFLARLDTFSSGEIKDILKHGEFYIED